MAEVKEFERHLRFKKYLAKEDALSQLPIRTKKDVLAAEKSRESERSNANESTSGINVVKESPITGGKDIPSPRHLAYLLQRSQTSRGDSAGSSSQGVPNSSQSGTSGSPRPTGWGNLPMTLPPPFSSEKRSVSDAQSLPSTHGVHAQPRRDGPSRDPPVTLPRRSSLREARTDIRSGSLSRGCRRRLVSSTVRFVNSIVHSPSHSSPSPSPSPHVTSSGSSSPVRDNESEVIRGQELGFRIYNDALPASSQPQTPQNLPEARHRSRLLGSYTAPVSRLASQSSHQSSSGRGTGESTHRPSDLETPGFRGLYDGLENSEDSTLFQEASRLQRESSLEVEGG
ncbi:hypothetical protein GGR54DRAFT_642650 [Hypoxylon sp. NC1633]|nr:hypothetical protein GGR54DRAFT_642650 [Hypoxylon sp. NC1633]